MRKMFITLPCTHSLTHIHTHTLDIFGALACSVAVGIVFAAFTCLLMYYDSDDPGYFPPTPVSPRREGE